MSFPADPLPTLFELFELMRFKDSPSSLSMLHSLTGVLNVVFA